MARKKLVQSTGLKRQSEYYKLYSHKLLPEGTPYGPYFFYPNEWINWYDWLGKNKDDSCRLKKELLLKMAQNGEPRPQCRSSLGIALSCYTKESSDDRHAGYRDQLIATGCDWFINSVVKTKQQLLKMAQNGEAKPHHKTLLGKALCRYTTKSPQHDPVFKEKLIKTGCGWFENSISYNPAPRDVEENKKQLLKMAQNGEPRPTQKTWQGRALSEYTRKNSIHYPIFKEQLIKTGCDWFKKSAKSARIKKQQLLELAQKGEPKPLSNTLLGRALRNYTNKNSSSYDAEFNEQIKNIVPEWFMNIGDRQKITLLEMVRRGESRPSSKTTRLGKALVCFTNKSVGRAYDPEFNREIREAGPYWFERVRYAS